MKGFETGDLALLVRQVIDNARSVGDAQMVVAGRDRVSGSEFADRVERTAAGLADAGLRAGDVVLFGVRPSVDCFVLSLACMRVGAVVTFVDPGAGAELFARRLALLQPAWVMAESLLYAATVPGPLRWYIRRTGMEFPDLAKIPARHVRSGPRVPGFVPRSLSTRALRRAVVSDSALGHLPATVDPSTTSVLVFTSGTTGDPKGVQHTGGSVVAAMQMMHDYIQAGPESVFYAHTAHAFVVAMLRRAATVVSPLSLTPARIDRDLRRHGVTHAFMLPIEAWNYAVWLGERGKAWPEQLQEVVLFSAPITTAVLERLHLVPGGDRLRIVCAYGMTEMLPVTCIQSHDKLAFSGDGDIVGAPFPGVEVRIADDGELLLRGPNLHKGYLGQEPYEWHHSGDLARLDEAGRIVLMGRKKDMIIRGDWNIYPGLYEETVGRIEGVAACAFVGVPDPITADERVVLFVEADATAGVAPDELQARVERGLRSGDTLIDQWALPDEVRVGELPRSGRSSKIDRRQLRELARPTQEVTA
ncbi:MAG: hypothetical protein JWO69_1366 [Thermoleophilia bacterium]|jgi:acyl-CoA synthetase (AMP-forming)/AMP-acid ligase II|nr:hypothetical protein [Thermoleophilia bacterium]